MSHHILKEIREVENAIHARLTEVANCSASYEYDADMIWVSIDELESLRASLIDQFVEEMRDAIEESDDPPEYSDDD
jgi:hypothetical protein